MKIKNILNSIIFIVNELTIEFYQFTLNTHKTHIFINSYRLLTKQQL